MKVLELLEQKVGVKFEGKTGEDLLKYLEKNFGVLVTNCKDTDEYYGYMDFDPSKFYLEMSKDNAMLFEGEFNYEYVIGKDGDASVTIKEGIEAGYESIMLECYIDGSKDCDSLVNVIEKVSRITKEHNITAELTTDAVDGDFDFIIKFDKGNYTIDGRINIIDDNGDELYDSFYWIAERSYKGLVEDYLKLPINYVKSNNQVSDLESRKELVMVKNSKEEIISQVTKMPRAIINYDQSIIHDYDVLKAFCESYSNNKSFIKFYHETYGEFNELAGCISDSIYKKIYRVSDISSKELKLNLDILVSDEDLMYKVCNSKAVEFVDVNSDNIELAISKLEQYPLLSKVIYRYYVNLFFYNKEEFNKFKAENDIDSEVGVSYCASLKVIDILKENNVLLCITYEWFEE